MEELNVLVLTKEVEIGLSPCNIIHYKKLGYQIPIRKDKRGRDTTPKNTKIFVKVKDLSNQSNAIIEVKCDNPDCKTHYPILIKWCNYKRYLKDNGLYYCHKCNIKLYGISKTNKSKLENSKSFKQWCVDNDREDVLNRWDYDLNKLNPNTILYGSKKQYYFKCPKDLHNSELKTISNFISGQEGSIKCKKCNSFAQWGIDNLGDDFLEKYWDYEKNTVDPWHIDFCSDKNVWIKCQEKDYHESYYVMCSKFINGQRCIYCNNNNGKVHYQDSLGVLYPQILYIWSNKNLKTPYEYAPNSNYKVYWKCPEGKHDDYYRCINNSNTYDFNCPRCIQEKNESFLQEKVRIYINKFKYYTLHEYGCNLKCFNPKTNRQLPYDNEIVELKLIVEVHGSQHYEIAGFHKLQAKQNNTTPEYEFYMQMLYDRYKRMYTKSKGYEYLEIPYWTDDENETWKKLIDDKINEILDNKNIKEDK